MAIPIGNFNFEGPFTRTDNLRNASGVYVILGKSGSTHWNVVDIGESGDLRNRVETHDRGDCWKRQGHSELAVAALYTTAAKRTLIEQELRTRYDPPCGKR